MLQEKLRQQGWYLTDEGIKKLTTNDDQKDDVNRIISLALDWDLKDIGAGALPSKPDVNGTISGGIVLQLQKMRNLSAPKSNEESTTAPRFLQLELSDGANTITALEFERIASLNFNVPPGTKLFIKGEKLKLMNGFLVLKSSDIRILGGKVEALIEKWELARQMLKYAKSNRRLSGSGGPPPWIAFGKRLDVLKEGLPTDKNFKSLQAANEKEKCSKENDDFNASRSQAIAEAAKAGHRKVFGGGQQNILDHNVKKILEKGYSEDDARQALKATNNILERSLYNLKRRNNKSGLTENTTKPASNSAGRARDRGGNISAKDDGAVTKPQANVSLFDFLTDKLPATISSANTAETKEIVKNINIDRHAKETNTTKSYNNSANSCGSRFENNISSSFAANRASFSTKSEDRSTIQSRSNYNSRKQESYSGNKIGKDGERSNSNRAKSQAPNYKLQNQKPSSHEDNANITWGNTKKSERPLKKDREQTNRHSANDYQPNKRTNDYNKNVEKKSYQARDFNRNQDSRGKNNYQQKQTQKNSNFEKALDNLVDSTSKLNIQSKKNLSSNSLKGRNYQQMTPEQLQNTTHNAKNSQSFSSTKSFQEQNTKFAANSPQMGNGFAYDPSKIIGFQSKEANEYAMNMLKSQGMNMQHIQQQQTSPPEAQKSSLPLPPPQQLHPTTAVLNNQTAAAVAYMTHSPNIFVAPPQQNPPQISMMTGENWPWKEGDLCLAKYWDDGNFYDAKITAISEKTCVVLFLGYGNYEEVLKSDCVPITDTQHLQLHTYPPNIAPPSNPELSQRAVQQRSNMNPNIGGGSQRYRGERQMYIPPNKRYKN